MAKIERQVFLTFTLSVGLGMMILLLRQLDDHPSYNPRSIHNNTHPSSQPNPSNDQPNNTSPQPNPSNDQPNTTSPLQQVKKILYWNTHFGRKIIPNPHTIDCEPLKCYISSETEHPEDFDALFFHVRDPQNPPKVRKHNQIYVAYTWESPEQFSEHFVEGRFYNWSHTFMRDSTSSFSYGSILPGKATLQIGDLPQMKKGSRKGNTVAWIVTNCHTIGQREDYVKELSRHIGVDVYGKCGQPCPGGFNIDRALCYKYIAQTGNYKFYLAFENSICKDYISEKSFRALKYGLVPIVYGGTLPTQYRDLLPQGSYIDVRDFKSPKKLAQYLKKLDGNKTEYLKFHAWRGNWRVGNHTDSFCNVCKKVHDESLVRRHLTLEWMEFWEPKKLCDRGFYKKVVGDGTGVGSRNVTRGLKGKS